MVLRLPVSVFHVGMDVSNVALVATSAGGIEIPRGSNKSSNGGLKGGSIAGVVVGVVIAALLIVGKLSDSLSDIYQIWAKASWYSAASVLVTIAAILTLDELPGCQSRLHFCVSRQTVRLSAIQLTLVEPPRLLSCHAFVVRGAQLSRRATTVRLSDCQSLDKTYRFVDS